MKKQVNSNLGGTAARVALQWKDCREQIGHFYSPYWEERSIKEYMWYEYIMVDTPKYRSD